jgi:hypothetical protein
MTQICADEDKFLDVIKPFDSAECNCAFGEHENRTEMFEWAIVGEVCSGVNAVVRLL